MTRTHTIAELVLSQAAYDEVRRSFEAAGYQHALGDDGMIDMTGVGVTRCPDAPSRVPVQERTVIKGLDGTETVRIRTNQSEADRRVQALGAAISRREWSEVEDAHVAIRDMKGGQELGVAISRREWIEVEAVHAWIRDMKGERA